MEFAGRRQGLIRILLAGLFAAVVVLGARWALPEELDPKAALSLLRSVQHRWWATPAFFAAYVGGTTALFPAVLFHMVAGAAWGFEHAVLLNLVAVNVTSHLHFLAARHLGRQRIAGLLTRFRFERFDTQVARHAVSAMVVIRLLPLPFVGVNAAAGVSAMRFSDFAIGSGLGSLPVTIVYTYFASRLVEGVAGAEQKALGQTLIAGLLLLLVTFLPRLWFRRRG
ncbi:MAG: TVP38/TMEM64 family protein [Myxococcota bacterium]